MDLLIFQFSCILLSFFVDLSSYLEITTVRETILQAQGQNVRLNCQFTLAPEDTGSLDIEWSILPSDIRRDEKVVIWYSGGRVYQDNHEPLKDRVYFNSVDHEDGDGSITLTGLKLSDSGTYQCKVMKVPGIRSRKMQLIVMMKPSKPRCSIKGPTHEGKDIMLKCLSSEGTIPLQYNWERINNSKRMPASAMFGPVGGTIILRNAPASASGTYRCTSRNQVGTEECILVLNVAPTPKITGIIAGPIVAVLLILIIIAILFYCCAHHRKKYERETSNDIREDASPPKSRVSKVNTKGSQLSSLSPLSPSNQHGLHPEVPV